jgi:hypothetical protein
MNHEATPKSRWVAALSIAVLCFLLFPAGDLPLDVRSARTHFLSEASASAPSELEYFYAREVTTGVELSWMAVSEKDIEGFKLYRRERGVPIYLLVNNEGLIHRWRYDFVDGDPKKGHTYLYVLGVVHGDGSEQISRPVEITMSSRSSIN